MSDHSSSNASKASRNTQKSKGANFKDSFTTPDKKPKACNYSPERKEYSWNNLHEHNCHIS